MVIAVLLYCLLRTIAPVVDDDNLLGNSLGKLLTANYVSERKRVFAENAACVSRTRSTD